MARSSIEWTQHTWNPTVGCDRISPGCANCYAKELHDRRHKAFLAGKEVAAQYEKPFETLQLMNNRLDVPLRRRIPTTYFVNSVSDLFHVDVPETFIDQVFAVMALTPQHTFQVLTKRAERTRAYVRSRTAHDGISTGEIAAIARSNGLRGVPEKQPEWVTAGRLMPWPLPNVWLGTSVENQHFADERIPLLLLTPAAVRFISAEPLLGPVDIRPYMPNALWNDLPSWNETAVDWVIVGGESGRKPRGMNLQWARSLVQQCQHAGVAVFMKQLGGLPYEGTATPYASGTESINCRVYELDIDKSHGGDMAEWPEDLRVREFPADISAERNR